MATAADKAEYDEKIAPLKERIASIEIKVNESRKKEEEVKSLEFAERIPKRVELLNLILEETNAKIALSRFSLDKIQFRNETVLNSARKNIYSIIQTLEEEFGREIDTPLNEGNDLLDQMTFLDNLGRFEIMKKIGFALDLLEHTYGDNTKWKWSFVEMEGRLATAMKNFTNFQELIRNLDPSIEGYTKRMDMLKLMMDRFEKSADRYRNKYELTGKRIDDMRGALSFVAFHKRLAILLGENEIAENSKKKYDTWNKKLNEDIDKDSKKK